MERELLLQLRRSGHTLASARSRGWASAPTTDGPTPSTAVYLPGGRVAFTYGGRTDLTPAVVETLGPVDPAVGNLTLRRGEAFCRWDIVYSGEAQDMDDRTVMLAASRDRPEGWARSTRLEMDVAFDAISDPHYAVGGARGALRADRSRHRHDPPRRRAVGRERLRRPGQVVGTAHVAGTERFGGQGGRTRRRRAEVPTCTQVFASGLPSASNRLRRMKREGKPS
jgi:hypothetical protein